MPVVSSPSPRKVSTTVLSFACNGFIPVHTVWHNDVINTDICMHEMNDTKETTDGNEMTEMTGLMGRQGELKVAWGIGMMCGYRSSSLSHYYRGLIITYTVPTTLF